MISNWKNNEGYKDPTPAEATRTVRPGELWDLHTSHGLKRVLILGEYDGVLQILYVRGDLYASPCAVLVPGGAVDPRFLAFGFTSNLESYAGRVTENVFASVRHTLNGLLHLDGIEREYASRLLRVCCETAIRDAFRREAND